MLGCPAAVSSEGRCRSKDGGWVLCFQSSSILESCRHLPTGLAAGHSSEMEGVPYTFLQVCTKYC